MRDLVAYESSLRHSAKSRTDTKARGFVCGFFWGKAGSGDILVCADWKELSVISCQMCGNLGRVCIRAWVRWMGRSAMGKPYV